MTRVFLSYRRADGGMAAGRLAGDLADRLGPGQVVRDVDSIKPGANFVETLHRELATCDALVALIGHHWLGGPESGGRRLDDPDDWVRIEIATALGRGIPVVPVLLDGARMPTPDLLPVELKPLTAIQAIQMSDAYWNPALANLLEALGEGPGFRWDRLRRSSRRWAARLTTMSRRVALSLAALTLLVAAVGIALGFWWFDPRSLRCWPPYGLAGPAAYESRTEIIPMAKDWSSAGAATRWALHSIGCRPTEDALYAMFVPALVNETVGMLDSSMRQLAAALKQHGLRAASARSVTFDDVASRAGQQPIVLFGARWGHHVGVRRTSASGDLELANPASGVPGNAAWSQQTLSREDFARLGPFSALWIEASPRPIPTPTPTPRRL